jgi:hypothetical protein
VHNIEEMVRNVERHGDNDLPWFHTSQEVGMVQCNKVIASLSLQFSSRHSLVKPLGTHDLQPETVRVSTSCLHSSLGVTSQLLGYLEYGIPLLWPRQRCQDQM